MLNNYLCIEMDWVFSVEFSVKFCSNFSDCKYINNFKYFIYCYNKCLGMVLRE